MDAETRKEIKLKIKAAAGEYTDLLEPFDRLGKDLKSASALLGRREVRYLVDTYYGLQKVRIRLWNQNQKLLEAGEPLHLTAWMFIQFKKMEDQFKRALEPWVEGQRVGRWLTSICGVGPIISAGLLANFDLEPWTCRDEKRKAKGKGCKKGAPCTPLCGTIIIHTAGHFWSFAGIAAHQEEKWLPKTIRPWNAGLKTLCAFKLGESFVKVQNKDSDVYGKIFAARRRLEEERNGAGMFSGQAAAKLEKTAIGEDTEAYKAYSVGKLPPAHLHARARRYAVRLFLSHFHHVMYEDRYKIKPPKPFVIEHMGHTDYIKPPNWPIE